MENFHVTILIPTRKRPTMLTNTLQSIRGQSRPELIKEVVISENSSDLQSEAIAAQFSQDLPIRFIRQPIELNAEEHFVALTKYSQSAHTALIGDDDMWDRYHLEEAQRAFKEHPDIVAYFGQSVSVANETCYPFASIGASLLQVPTLGDRSLQDFLIWDKRETAMQCMSHTPLNMWALVSDTRVLQSSMECSFGQSPFRKAASCDKILIWELAKHGTMAIGRHISLFYRRHNETGMENFLAKSVSQVEESDFDLTMEIANQALSFGINAPRDWRRRYDIAAKNYGLSGFIRPWNPRLSEFLMATENEDSHAEDSKKSHVDSFLYLITPPLVMWTWRKLKTSGNVFLKKG
jgi:glycosyltransferase involved in cell wall biosynthesis